MDATFDVSLLIRGATSGLRDERFDRQYQAVIQSLTKYTTQDIALTAGQIDKAVTFGEVTTAKLVVIIASTAVAVKLNGAATAVTVGKFFAAVNDAGVTSISLTETETAACTATVVLVE